MCYVETLFDKARIGGAGVQLRRHMVDGFRS